MIQALYTLPSQARAVRAVTCSITTLLREWPEWPASEQTLSDIDLALTEAITNAVEHAHRGNSGLTVRVEISFDEARFTARIHDSGPGFDLSSIPEPVQGSLEERGRGLFLIRKLMDRVSYGKEADGNVLEIALKLSSSSGR